MMIDTVFEFKPGGMLNVLQAGVIEGAGLRPRQGLAAVGSSSGAAVATYWLSGQINLVRDIFIDELTSREVYDPRRMLLGRWPLDPHHLVDHCCRDLDIHTLEASPTPLYVGVFRSRDAKTIFERLDGQNWQHRLKATAALPIIGPSIVLPDNEHYRDGGIDTLAAIRFAYEQLGCRRVVQLCNQPVGSVARVPSRLASWVMFPRSSKARKVVRARGDQSFAPPPPADLSTYVIAPREPVPATWLTRSKDQVRRTYDIGFDLGIRHRLRLQDFLGG